MTYSPLRSFFLRVFVVLILLMVLFPFVWCLIISLQRSAEVNSAYAILLPRSIQVKNYLTVLRNAQFFHGLLNSLVISLLSVGMNLLLCVPAGFALARVKTRFSALCLRAVLLFMFVPVALLAVPLQKMLSGMGLSGTHWMVALPLCVMSLTVLIFYAFYARFPSEMDDCATLLGIPPALAFWKVYLPVSGRAIAYAAIAQFITTWNCAFLPMFMYRGSWELKTVQSALLQYALMPRSIYLGMAAVIIACLPCWLLHVLRNRIGTYAFSHMTDPLNTDV